MVSTPKLSHTNIMGILHLVGIPFSGCGGLLVLIYYVFTKQEYTQLDDKNFREIMNFSLSFLIYFVVCLVLMLVLIGFLLIFIVGLVWFVLVIIGGIRNIQGEYFHYPLTIQFFSVEQQDETEVHSSNE